MAVVPGDEVCGAVGPVELGAGDGERRVLDAAGREDDRVVVVVQLVERDVGAEVDIGEEADVAALEHLVQRLDDHLDARVVGCDAVAHEPERRGEALDEVDRDVDVRLREDVRGVDAGGAGADDRDAQGAVVAHELVPSDQGGVPGGAASVGHRRPRVTVRDAMLTSRTSGRAAQPPA